jgi:serine/threonine-protein kinase
MQPRDHAALLAELERSGILKPGQLEGMTVDFGSDTPASLSAFAQAMIQRQVLTEFQAEELLEGRLADCVIAGRYHLQEKLGQGGMGAVYKARDTQLDRVVAVKVLPAHSLGNADAVARFQREARALARLSHAHIVQAYDSGQDRDRHFLVMEYVDGFSLSAILREQGALPATLAADYIHQAALGLHHAHDKGLIHRDLKPGNLLVSPDRDVEKRGDADSRTPAPMRGLVKILDLGLARFLQDQIGDSQLTQEGIGVGTPDYMAPEQFRDALHADVRTDIYGLGCTLYHLIGGTVPFPGSSFSEKARAHANKEPIPLEERCPEVPAGLAFVVSKMMAKHPSERFQSALEVAEALAPYVAGASHSMILLRQTMRFHRGQLTMRASPRKPLLLWGGLAAAILLVAALAVFAWPYLFPSDGPSQAQATPPPTVSPTAAPTLAPTVPPQPTQPQKPVIETIDNGVTVAKDGRGQFTTIVAALDKIKPGQTIRVLDSANYEETLQITRPGQHAAGGDAVVPAQGKPRHRHRKRGGCEAIGAQHCRRNAIRHHRGRQVPRRGAGAPAHRPKS